MKIVIELNSGRKIELTADEAKEVKTQLDEILSHPVQYPYPYPVEPYEPYPLGPVITYWRDITSTDNTEICLPPLV